MKAFLRFLVLTPVAAVLLLFAFANRHNVIVSFDPFAGDGEAGIAVAAPMFLVMFVAAMLGVLAGGAATWLTQGKHRKAARRNRAEAERLRGNPQTPRARDDERFNGSAGLQHRA